MEHAAACYGTPVSFKNLFLSGEKDDEQTAALAEVLGELRRLYPHEVSFKASAIAERCRAIDLSEITFKTNLEAASGRGMQVATVQTVSARLRSCVDRPTLVEGALLTLRYRSDHEGGRFYVTRARSAG